MGGGSPSPPGPAPLWFSFDVGLIKSFSMVMDEIERTSVTFLRDRGEVQGLLENGGEGRG